MPYNASYKPTPGKFQSNTYKVSIKPANKEKKCLNCGNPVERENNPLYFRSFCSIDCKERYMLGSPAHGNFSGDKASYY